MALNMSLNPATSATPEAGQMTDIVTRDNTLGKVIDGLERLSTRAKCWLRRHQGNDRPQEMRSLQDDTLRDVGLGRDRQHASRRSTPELW